MEYAIKLENRNQYLHKPISFNTISLFNIPADFNASGIPIPTPPPG
jgi:hypothetical protein